MAPALVETVTETLPAGAKEFVTKGGVGDYKELYYGGPKHVSKEQELQTASHPNYLPTWNPEEKYPPLQSFQHYDHGKDADPTFSHLLAGDGKVKDLTGNIGAEVTGVQLSKLSDKGKDELALFIAQKKVAAFRDQDLADIPISEAVEFGRYFGRLHIHPTSGSPAGHPEIHLVHRAEGDHTAQKFLEEQTNTVTWHSDITYEQQPPGTTFLYILDGPHAGGDTIFANQAEAYNRLSPEFRKRLHGLQAVHSGIEQVEASRKNGSIVKREPVVNVHPVVRTHPVTGEKAIYVNPQFTRRIVGYKKEESDFLLRFLFEHLAKGQDFQVRIKWEPGTVVVWDNRVTAHTALLDWHDGQRRHLARITPQAERPCETPFEG